MGRVGARFPGRIYTTDYQTARHMRRLSLTLILSLLCAWAFAQTQNVTVVEYHPAPG